MEISDVVFKLVGSVRPRGESSGDAEKFENLKTLCSLVDELVKEINYVSYSNKDSYEASVKRCQEYAERFLTETLGIAE